MTAPAAPTSAHSSRRISLVDVAEGRVWCPFTGKRAQVPGSDRFAADTGCIGPRCAGWDWLSPADALETETRRLHLVPPHFSPGYRVRLASQLFPELVAALTALAGGGDGDADGARGWILDWAAAHWRPEDDLPEPESWRRLAAPQWDETADTVALDLVRTRSDEQRAGQCGMKSPRASADAPARG